jgi:hypothetical protein
MSLLDNLMLDDFRPFKVGSIIKYERIRDIYKANFTSVLGKSVRKNETRTYTHLCSVFRTSCNLHEASITFQQFRFVQSTNLE